VLCAVDRSGFGGDGGRVSIPWKQGSALRRDPEEVKPYVVWVSIPWKQGSALRLVEVSLAWGEKQCFNPLETGKCSAPLFGLLLNSAKKAFQSLGNREVLCAFHQKHRSNGSFLFQSLGNREVLCATTLP